MTRSRLFLLLVVLLLISLWYAWQETPRQQKVAGKKVASKNIPISTANKKTSDADAALDFTGGEKLAYQKPKRDLFRPLYRAPVIVKKPVAAPKPVPVVVAPPPPPPKPRPVVKPVTGPKPIPKMNVLGFLHKGAGTTVFLSTRQGELFLVKKGDRFADGLLVRELDERKIVVSRGLDDVGVTMTIGEPKTQRMAIPHVKSGRPAVPEYKSPASTSQKPAAGAGQD